MKHTPAVFEQTIRRQQGRAQLLRVLSVGGILLGATVARGQPAMTLHEGGVNATVTFESDASANAFGDTASVAPDLYVGATNELTISLVHSTFARTGFRGVAGAGICATDGCANVYDNAGVEGTYSLLRGPFAVAANVGVHATSFDRDFYVAKLGAKARWSYDRFSVTTLPSLTIAATERNVMAPNRDRIWLPVAASARVAGGLSLGGATGFKAALDEVGATYEVAAGVMGTYAHSRALTLGVSWVHGKIVGGDAALPGNMQGIDQRALHVWLSATH